MILSPYQSQATVASTVSEVKRLKAERASRMANGSARREQSPHGFPFVDCHLFFDPSPGFHRLKKTCDWVAARRKPAGLEAYVEL
jgi:hypothetical protein